MSTNGKVLYGKVQGNLVLPEQVESFYKKVGDEYFDECEAGDFSGDAVSTANTPAWLRSDATSWLPDLGELGFKAEINAGEIALTVGVDQHIDNIDGPVLLVAFRNDGLEFSQGKERHVMAVGDWLIFDDRKKHGMRAAKGRSVFVGWVVPLLAL